MVSACYPDQAQPRPEVGERQQPGDQYGERTRDGITPASWGPRALRSPSVSSATMGQEQEKSRLTHAERQRGFAELERAMDERLMQLTHKWEMLNKSLEDRLSPAAKAGDIPTRGKQADGL